MFKKRAQASLEYVLIVGFALLMLMPLIIIYAMQEEIIRDDVNIIQGKKIVDSIVDNSEKVRFIGSPSKTTLEVRMPYNVEHINISNDMVLIRLRTSGDFIDIYRYSKVNLSGEIDNHPGIRKIEITAHDDFVNISSG